MTSKDEEDDGDSVQVASPSSASLQRTASILARQLAMAKLTGSSLPPVPKTGLLDPLPTLDELQSRALEKQQQRRRHRGAQSGWELDDMATTTATAMTRPGLRRENTVTGTRTASSTLSSQEQLAGPTSSVDREEGRVVAAVPPAPLLRRNHTVSGTAPPFVGVGAHQAAAPTPAPAPTPNLTERETVRANLIRKLSARRGVKPSNSPSDSPLPSAPLPDSAAAAANPIPPVFPGSGLDSPTPLALAPPIPSLVGAGGSRTEIAHASTSAPTTATAPASSGNPSSFLGPLAGQQTVVVDSQSERSTRPAAVAVADEQQTGTAGIDGSGRTGDDDGGDDSSRLQHQQSLSMASEPASGLRSDSIATTASTISTSSSTSTSTSTSTSSGPPLVPQRLTGNPRTARPLPTFGIAAVEGSGAYRDRDRNLDDEVDDDEVAPFRGGKKRERGSSASSSVFGLAAAGAVGAGAAGTVGGRIRGSDAGSVSFPFGTDLSATAATPSSSSSSSPPRRRTSRLGSIGLGVFTPLGLGDPRARNQDDDGMPDPALTAHTNANLYGWTTTSAANPRRASVVSQSADSSTSSTSSSSISSTRRRRERRSGASGTEESIGEEEEEGEEGEEDRVEEVDEDGRTPTLDRAAGNHAGRNRSPAGSAQTDETSQPSSVGGPTPGSVSAGGGTPVVEQTPRLGAYGGGGWERDSPKLDVHARPATEAQTLGLGRGGSPAARMEWSPQQQRFFQQVSTSTDGTVEKRPFAFNLGLADYRPVADSVTSPREVVPNENQYQQRSHLTLPPPSSTTMADAPISPTSVIPNPMEALMFPLAPRPQLPSPRRSPRLEGSEHVYEHERERESPQSVAGSRSHRTAPIHGSPSLRRSLAGGDSDCSLSPPETTRRDHVSAVPSSSPLASSPSLSASSSLSRESSPGLPPTHPRVTRLPVADLPANRILAKLDSILGPVDETVGTDTEPPTTMLNDPPRKLLLHAPVLQVVNANTVKDRYLVLFNDLLVIAKPLIEDHLLTGEPVPPSLDSHFLVKSVVECKQLKLSGDEDSVDEAAVAAAGATGSKKKHPLLVAFVDRFANDPSRAIASLIQKGGLANDGQTIANLLYRNTDLNRNQLGAYLADRRQKHVLRAYIERFRFAGVRIDDALRLFLMSVRLPWDPVAAEYVVDVLAGMWSDANTSTGIDAILAHELMMAITRLSDALHGGDGPGERFFRESKPETPPTVDDFIASFRNVDTRAIVPEDLLARIYTAVRRERVELASDNSIFSMTPDIEATIEPAKLPTQLTYKTPSARFTISIPAPDSKFTIKLQGADLQFEPPVLSFARSTTQSFRVTGMALGIRTMVLVKRGANAPRYQGLPINKAFSIERGFMQHTFQLSFTNHLDLKRKYMFSCRDLESRSRWLHLLRDRIAACSSAPAPPTSAQAAAQAVAVQVLRDALLAPEEPILSGAAPSARPNVLAPRFGRPVTPVVPRGRLGTPTRPTTSARSNSVSRLYPVLYRSEAEASDKRPSPAIRSAGSEGNLLSPSGVSSRVQTTQNSPDPAGSETATAKAVHGAFVKTGDELVLTTEQNSLLPLVLSFLNAGLDAAPAPLSLNGSAFQLPQLDGTTAPTLSFISQT